MTGAAGGALPLPAPNSGGEFLLRLLQQPNQPQPQPQHPPPPTTAAAAPPPPPPPQPNSVDHHHPHDPAVAAMGPTLPLPPPWTSNGHDLNTPWPSFFPPGFSQNPNPWTPPSFPPSGIDKLDFHRSSHLAGNHPLFVEDLGLGRLGHSGGVTGKLGHQQQQHQQPKPQENLLMFGSLKCELGNQKGLSNGSSSDPQSRGVTPVNIEGQFEVAIGSKSSQNSVNSSRNCQFDGHSNSLGPQQGNHEPHEQGRGGIVWGRQQQSGFQSSIMSEPKRMPPGFPQKPRGLGQRGSVGGRGNLEHIVDRDEESWGPEYSGILSDMSSRLRLSGQLDHPGPPTGSNLHSVHASDIEETLADLRSRIAGKGHMPQFLRQEEGNGDRASAANARGGHRERDVLAEQHMGSLVQRDRFGNTNDVRKHNSSHGKDFRSDKFRGERAAAPGHRMRNYKVEIECRSDINRLNAPFLTIYESLVPAEEEKAKQKQLLTLLEKLVNKEWPKAQLYLYGSCANSFGVSNSDIDVCLAIEDADISKSEILLKLADILQSDNLENVQALTRARVPIVKLMDPVTGISCDICINNVLAVVNTKLLRDYAQIDARLRQLAFIVKHWAKSRGVNETYRGTLSSYAYVLMCIHFLQQRKPAILPCLQGMEVTYAVTVDDVECAYFDRVQSLCDFGIHNKENIAQLVWGFFDYWAYRHDYANTVISVRTGSIISKRAKDWTRRIGNDRHLICIEDPFETSHDLGRVVDKYSIKVLREEFERAANIMQYDPDPCVTLFEPFVPS